MQVSPPEFRVSEILASSPRPSVLPRAPARRLIVHRCAGGNDDSDFGPGTSRSPMPVRILLIPKSSSWSEPTLLTS